MRKTLALFVLAACCFSFVVPTLVNSENVIAVSKCDKCKKCKK